MRSNRTYQWAHAAGLTSGAYAFQLSSGSWVDGEDASRSSWARYINHAYGKGANVAPYGRGRPFIYFESIRDIEEGEVRLCTLGLKPFSSTVCALPDTEYQRSRPLRDRSCSSTTATPMSTRLPVFLAGLRRTTTRRWTSLKKRKTRVVGPISLPSKRLSSFMNCIHGRKRVSLPKRVSSFVVGYTVPFERLLTYLLTYLQRTLTVRRERSV